MAKNERRERIVEFVNAAGSISFSRLKQEFPDVSEMTLRTDLKSLDEEKRILRVHGGARSVSFAVGSDDLFSRRAVRNITEKKAIAQAAAKLIHPDTAIFIDSGSTTTALASVMPDIHVLAFTNSLTVAAELSHHQNVETIIVGGKFDASSACTTGGTAIETVSSLTFDQAFMGATGYSRRRGFTCGLDDQAVFKRTALARSERGIMLMDSSKEGRHSTFPICKLADVNTLITDGDISPQFAADCEFASVDLIRV